MCSIFSHDSKAYVQKSIKTNNSRCMEAQNNMEGAKALESVVIASQQTHYEPTNVTDADVTPTGKGLDQAN